MKKNEQSLRKMWNILKHLNIHIIRKGVRKGAVKYLKT